VLNAISVDVEDYFQVEAFASHISPKEWDSYTPRVERNVVRVLELFDRHSTRGTFFILGWVAERNRGLVRRIAEAGHEIGCHGFAHQNIGRQTPDEFRMDVRRARASLMDAARSEISCYRAPSFSIFRKTLWALDILAEEGFSLDSSIFPVRHDVYGIPDAPRFPYWHNLSGGCSLFEFPPSTFRFGNINLGIGGGGYLRFAPYGFSHRAIRMINEKYNRPAMVYFHPWELDPDQPRINARLRSRLRHYTGLATMESKIERLLCDFCFTTIAEASEQLEEYQSGCRIPGRDVMTAKDVLAPLQ
jgi:polysaccharide deacetylase family protein (PEP-CTERM system associated)